MYTDKSHQFEGNPYYMVKRYFEKVVNNLGIDSFEYELLADTLDEGLPIWIENIIPTFERNSSVLIYKRNGKKRDILGVMGEINSEVKESFKLPNYTSGLEIDLELLKKVKTGLKQYKESSKYPPLTQDICFTVNRSVTYKQIEEKLKQNLENRNTNVYTECVDIYMNNESDSTKKVTVRVTVEHMEKTLTDKNLEKSKKAIEESLSKL
jgi:phenylalanyl-tRNA synthetase beta subunit